MGNRYAAFYSILNQPFERLHIDQAAGFDIAGFSWQDNKAVGATHIAEDV